MVKSSCLIVLAACGAVAALAFMPREARRRTPASSAPGNAAP